MSPQAVLQLTQAQVAALTLRKQYISQPAREPLDVVQRVVAIQVQYAANVPLAIWARHPGLPTDWTADALDKRRTLVKTWCLRGTLHVLTSADLALMVGAVGEQQRREHEHFMKTRRGVEGPDLERLNRAILQALAQHPLGRSELHTSVPGLASLPGASWGLDVRGLAFSGDIVCAEAKAARSTFARREAWLPALAWDVPTPAEAQKALLLRYLAGYGPASQQDFAHWSGLKMGAVRAAWEACAPALIRCEVEGHRGEYALPGEDEPLIQEVEGDIPRLCLLPKFDPLLMGYADKGRLIDQADLPRVYRPAAEVEAVVLWQGRAAATWRARRVGSRLRLTVEPFRRLGEAERAEIDEVAGRLAAFLGAGESDVAMIG